MKYVLQYTTSQGLYAACSNRIVTFETLSLAELVVKHSSMSLEVIEIDSVNGLRSFLEAQNND